MEIIGHKKEKEQLQIALESARKRNKAMPHMLFSGAPGCGKTTMARELAKMAGNDFLSVVPKDIKDYDSVLNLVERLNHEGYDLRGNRIKPIRPTIVFLDEIHRTPAFGQEVLGLVMERFILESGQPNKFFWAPYFTVVGATTDDGKLNRPFFDRFELRFIFEPYELGEMIDIIKMHAKKLGVNIMLDGTVQIAKRSRGTPRIAVRYLKRLRDWMLTIGTSVATDRTVKALFNNLGIDELGLSHIERKLMRALYDNGSPVGLENLAMILHESKKNVSETLEPFLIRQGLIVRSGKGREITKEGIRYLKNTGYSGQKKMEIPADYVRQ